MADKKEFPLSIVLRTVDRYTAGLQKFNAKIEKAFKPYRNLGKEMGKFSEGLGLGKVGTSLANVGSQVKGLALGFAAVGTAATLASAHVFKGWVNRGDQLAETAERIGINVDALSGLRFAAKRANVEASDFDNSLDQLSKRLGQLKMGKGPLSSFLKQGNLAPVFRQQVKGAKSVEEAFGLIADAMKKVQSPQERAALADAFFGKQGKNLINMLAQGNPELEKLIKRYKDLAGPQERFAKTSSALSDAFDDIGAAMDGVGATMVNALGPTVKDLSERFASFIAQNRGRIAAWAEDFARKLPGMIGKLGEMLDKFKGIWDAIGGAKGALAIFAGIKLLPLVTSVVQLGVALGQSVAGLAALAPALGAAAVALAPVAAVLAGIAATLAASYAIAKKLEPHVEMESRSGFAKDMEPDWIDKLMGRTDIGGKSESHVLVEFKNAPKGMRVTGEGTGEIDLGVGFAMGTP